MLVLNQKNNFTLGQLIYIILDIGQLQILIGLKILENDALLRLLIIFIN